MAQLQRMEEESKLQEKRFSELVQISRNEEVSREKAEAFAHECQEALKTAEDRVVRLLSRLHAETSNTTRLKKIVKETQDKIAGKNKKILVSHHNTFDHTSRPVYIIGKD